jgi:hypothetical protein
LQAAEDNRAIDLDEVVFGRFGLPDEAIAPRNDPLQVGRWRERIRRRSREVEQDRSVTCREGEKFAAGGCKPDLFAQRMMPFGPENVRGGERRMAAEGSLEYWREPPQRPDTVFLPPIFLA